jgi:hypothetical protein
MVEKRRKSNVASREGIGADCEGSRAWGSGNTEIASFVNFEALSSDEYFSSASLASRNDGQEFGDAKRSTNLETHLY